TSGWPELEARARSLERTKHRQLFVGRRGKRARRLCGRSGLGWRQAGKWNHITRWQCLTPRRCLRSLLRSQGENALEREPLGWGPPTQPVCQSIRLPPEFGLLELSRRGILPVRLDQFPGDVRLVREDHHGLDSALAEGPGELLKRGR